MGNSYVSNCSVTSTRTKVMDITLPYSISVSCISLSCSGGDPVWEIYFDKDINELAAPALPTLAAATTAGNILRSTKVFVRIIALDANGKAGPASDTLKSVTTGSGTDTNKVTVTIGAVAGAVSYDVYAGLSPGMELFVSNTTSTTFIITDIPTDINTRIYSDPDIQISAIKNVLTSIPIAGSLTISSRMIVYVTPSASASPYVSIIGN